MDLALPPMPFSAVFVPEQGQVAPIIPEEMRNDGPGGKDRRITLPPGVVQVIVSWRGVDPLYLRHFITGSSLAYETVASIPATSSPEARSTGVLTFSSEESHQIQVIHAGGGQWDQGTIDNGYVVGVQVMPMGTAADITGGGSLLRVDNSVGTRVFLGDQMIHGDTGRRALTTWDAEGVISGVMPDGLEPTPGWAGGVYLRRENNLVSLYIRGCRATSSQVRVDNLGYGWTATDRTWELSFARIGTFQEDKRALVRLGSGHATITGVSPGDPFGTNQYHVVIRWAPDDGWPTTLPGTPF